MKKWYTKFEDGVYSVFSIIVGVLIGILFFIINVQVLARYLFRVNIGVLAELPCYIMIASIWFGAVLVAKENSHITINLIDLFIKNKKVLCAIEFLIRLILCATLIWLTVLSVKFVGKSIQDGIIDTATRLPFWILQLPLPIGTGFMSLFYLAHAIRKGKELFEK